MGVSRVTRGSDLLISHAHLHILYGGRAESC